jgi:hypothetical protein
VVQLQDECDLQTLLQKDSKLPQQLKSDDKFSDKQMCYFALEVCFTGLLYFHHQGTMQMTIP